MLVALSGWEIDVPCLADARSGIYVLDTRRMVNPRGCCVALGHLGSSC